MSDADLTPVSVERSDGRILTGVGVSADDLQTTMERHAPPDDTAESVQSSVTATAVADRPLDSAASDKVRPARKRIDQITYEREEAKREAATAKSERDAIKAELEALKTRPAAVSPQPETPRTPAAPAPEKFAFPAYDDAYLSAHPDASWDDWNRDQITAATKWNIEQGGYISKHDLDARVRSSIEADRASRTAASTVESVLAKGRAAYPDFDAVRGQVHDVKFQDGQIPFILDQPNAEHLIYKIASDRALAQELASANPVQFGMKLASLVTVGSAAPLASTPSAGSVVAPAPYQPVGSGSRTTVPPSADLAKRGFDFDASGYRERRAAERKVRRH